MSRPIQRAIFAGSVQNANTVAGLASIRISRSMTPSAATVSSCITFLLFGGTLEARQPVVPELFEPHAGLGRAAWPGAIETPSPVAPLRDEPGLAQHGQVLGDRRAGHVERP